MTWACSQCTVAQTDTTHKLGTAHLPGQIIAVLSRQLTPVLSCRRAHMTACCFPQSTDTTARCSTSSSRPRSLACRSRQASSLRCVHVAGLHSAGSNEGCPHLAADDQGLVHTSCKGPSMLLLATAVLLATDMQPVQLQCWSLLPVTGALMKGVPQLPGALGLFILKYPSYLPTLYSSSLLHIVPRNCFTLGACYPFSTCTCRECRRLRACSCSWCAQTLSRSQRSRSSSASGACRAFTRLQVGHSLSSMPPGPRLRQQPASSGHSCCGSMSTAMLLALKHAQAHALAA